MLASALPAAVAATLAPVRELLAFLASQIAAFVATLDEVARFGGAHEAESYLGLVPGEWSSGGRQRRGHVTKTGNRRTRALLVQAAWSIWRSRRRDAAPLQHWAAGVARRRGKPIAVVALARQLAGVLFAMWRDGTGYDLARLRRSGVPA